MPVADLAARSGGVPERAHRLAVEWARAEAAGRLADAADDTGADRDGLRRSEQRLASTVVELRALRERAGARDAEPATTVCPYKGLAPFDRADAAFFFGRERLVAEMVARLVGARLLGVVGPSGGGKSSALRAGLLPELAGGVLPGSEDWAYALLRPGEHPLRSLEAATATTTPHRRLLIAVDQFDEAFTLCADEGERAAFVDALVGSAGGSGSVVVLALRAEFYGRCAAYPELARLLGANHVLVGPMQRDELRRAIELPAQRAGLRVERELVERLLADAADEPGALPLLSSALFELWQQRDGRHLRLAAYERTGGVRGAVARLAEAAYDRLDPAQQDGREIDPAAPRRRGRRRRRRAAARPARRNSTRTATTSAQRSTRSRAAGSCSSTRAPRRWPTRRCCASGRGCAAGSRRTPTGGACTAAWRSRRASGTPAGAIPAISTAVRASPRRSTGAPGTAPSSTSSSARSSRRASRTASARRAARGAPTGACAPCSPAPPPCWSLAGVAGVLFLDQRGAGARRGADRGGAAARRAGARRARPRPLAAARAPGRGDRRLAADA